nr:MAG: sodium/potassium-transporting ATPase subunit beta-like protein [Marsupenaeus japonicus endogenous nimavirus]
MGLIKAPPCVLLTLSIDDSFRPEPYENMDELPKDIPQDLRIDIEDEANGGKLKKGIYVDCTYEYLYTPGPLFPDYYFDNINVEGYLPPVVGVKFNLREKKMKQLRLNVDSGQRILITQINDPKSISHYSWNKNMVI